MRGETLRPQSKATSGESVRTDGDRVRPQFPAPQINEPRAMPLIRLTYFSTNKLSSSTGPDGLKALMNILACANRRNRQDGVTGVLAFDEHTFIQVLEGEREAVWAIFLKILGDERHADVTLVEFRETSERMFENWSMGLACPAPDAPPLFAQQRDSEGRLKLAELDAETILGIVTRMAVASYETLGNRL
jgi:hypothetical protein